MSEKKLLTEIMNAYMGVKLPVNVSAPPVRSSRGHWELTDEKILRKTYEFSTMEERNAFLYTCFQQDSQSGARHSRTTIDGFMVKVELGTQGGLLIDLDKQRAKMMDSLWRDVVYCVGGKKL